MSKADDIYQENVYGLFEYAKELEAKLETASAEMQERCAKVCDHIFSHVSEGDAANCADAIRALDKEK